MKWKIRRRGRGGTRSPYARRWLELLDPAIVARRPDDPSDLPRIRPMELVVRDGHLTADFPARKRAARATLRDTPGPSLAAIAAQSAEENGLVPIMLPGSVFNADRANTDEWNRKGAPLAPPEGSVIVAVIDDAIGFANERFRKGGRGDKTRFDYVWLQGVRGGPVKSDLPFGRELDATEINGLLTDFRRGGLIDEAGLYREIGYIDFLQSSVQSAASATSHGTAVSDRAGGDGAGGLDGPKLTDVDEMIVLMGVCLPSQVIGDTAGTFIEQYIILALERIQQRVRWLEAAAGRRYPLVVNLSFALTAGAQHRRGLLDAYLRVASARHHADLPAAQRMPLVVVGPAGNHRLTKSHAVVPGPGAHPPLFWRLLPDDRTPSFIEVWSAPHPKVPAPTIHCALRPPGVASPSPIPSRVAFGDTVELKGGGQKYAEAHYAWYPENPADPRGPGRQRIVVSTNPTTADWPGQSIAPCGDWRIEILGATAPVDLRVQRDDSLAGYRQRGRQSYLVDPTYADYDAAGRPIVSDDGSGVVTRGKTVNQLLTATPRKVHVISAHARLGGWPQPGGAATTRGVQEMIYSGLGAPAPAKIGVREIADATLVHRGIVTAGTLSGAAAFVSGTSVAAPWAAREIALALINANPGDPPPGIIPAVPAPFGPVDRVEL